MDRNEILTLTVERLKTKLSELNLPTTGTKQILRDRLIEALNLQNAENDVEEFFDSIQEPQTPSHFTLRDVQESVSFFKGTNSPNIKQWLDEFEDCASAVGWNNLQKYIYAKQLLKGAALIFIRSQSNISNWNKLKNSLTEEFDNPISASEIHKILSNKKKKLSQSLQEFLYEILEISKHIELDESSIIDYFIEGIPDANQNKTILYEAKTIQELKAKIKIYEKIRHNSTKNKHCNNCPHLNNHNTLDCKKSKFCQACNRPGHQTEDCRSRQKYYNKNTTDNYQQQNRNQQSQNHNQNHSQNYSYNPNQIYHRNNQNQYQNSFRNNQQNLPQNQCPKYNSSHNQNTRTDRKQLLVTEQRSSNVPNPGNDFNVNAKICQNTHRLFQIVKIKNVSSRFLIDTGCDLTLMRESVFNLLENVKLSKYPAEILGIGKGGLETLGYITEEIEIENIRITIDIHIARDEELGFESLLGNNIFKHLDMMIKPEGIFFKKRKIEKLPDIHCLNAIEMDSNELDTDLIGAEKQELANIIENFNPTHNEISPIEMTLVLSDDIPVSHHPRRISFHEQKIIENQVEEWLKAKIIRKSNSEYAAPVVLVSKKDGSKRLCCDYRKLNNKIVKDNFPMLLIDDALQKLQGAKVFTTIDLKNGFFHVPVAESSKKYTAFVTHNGQYEFNYCPFGICNSPAVFCRYIATIFHELIRNNEIIVYMDDIIIPTKTIQEGFEELRKVIKIAEKHNLKINLKKSQFLKNKVSFLGYEIHNSTIKPSIEKIKAVLNYPVPKDQKSLQRFLGLTSYFRRFIQNHAFIAKPLTDLLMKNSKYEFKEEQRIAFEELKVALTTAPLLKMFNPHAYTEVHTDASIHGYGGILFQKDSETQQLHVVEYMSRKTTPCQQKYSSYELEVLAVIEALKKWRCYLLGIKFQLITDCNAFTGTINKKDVPLRVNRWVMFLQDYDFDVQHRSGTKMRHVDALSRIRKLCINEPMKQKIISAQDNDIYINTLRKIAEKEQSGPFYLKYNILYTDTEKELIVIPESLEREIIETAHKQGHFAAAKTAEIVRKNFFIVDLEKKAKNIVSSCIECLLIEAKTGKKEGISKPFAKANQPLDTLHIDHIGPFEATKKQYNYIFTIVDAFSKFTWLYPTRSTTADEVLKKLENHTTNFGYPNKIISDRGTAFTSNNFKEFCSNNSISHHLITTGVPRENGQVERIQRTVIAILAKLCVNNKENWYKHINKIQQFINSTPPRSTKIAPFKILTGLDMKLPGLDEIKNIIEEEVVAELDRERDSIRETARENILKIQEENMKNFNRNRKIEREYQVDDLVAIKRTQFGTNLKIKAKFLGPYKIIKVNRNGRYIVEKVGESEGPKTTSTIAEYLKPWQ